MALSNLPPGMDHSDPHFHRCVECCPECDMPIDDTVYCESCGAPLDLEEAAQIELEEAQEAEL